MMVSSLSVRTFVCSIEFSVGGLELAYDSLIKQ